MKCSKFKCKTYEKCLEKIKKNGKIIMARKAKLKKEGKRT